MAQLSPKISRDYCRACPNLCFNTCPISEVTGRLAHSPWAKMNLAKALLEEELPWTLENALPAYQCHACGQCQAYCAHSIDVPQGLQEVRDQAVDLNLAPAGVWEIKKNFEVANHPYPAKKINVPKNNLSNDSLEEGRIFWPSCHTLRYYPQKLKVYDRLFKKLKIEGLSLWQGPLPCCGAPLKHVGLRQDYLDLSEVLYHSLTPLRTVVMENAECARSFQQASSHWGPRLKYKVLSLSEFLLSYLQHHPFKTAQEDPGPKLLIKPLAISEEPFVKLYEMLTGINLRVFRLKQDQEPTWGVEQSYHRLFPELATQLAKKNLAELPKRAHGTLLTACSLSQWQIEKQKPSWKVKDFYQWMEEILIS